MRGDASTPLTSSSGPQRLSVEGGQGDEGENWGHQTNMFVIPGHYNL